MDDEHDESDEQGGDPGASRRRWRLVGRIVGVLLCVGGLTLIGFLVLVMVSLNSWGSNK